MASSEIAPETRRDLIKQTKHDSESEIKNYFKEAEMRKEKKANNIFFLKFPIG